jgi:hypothetical protein
MISLLWAALAFAGEPAPCGALLDERMVMASAPGRDAITPCLGMRADVAGRFTLGFPDDGLSRRVELARARLELGVWGAGPASARIAFTSVRSGGTTGYIGVEGEAIVPVLQVAEARIDGRRWGLSAAAGLVDDVWVMSGEQRWNLRPVAPTAVEERRLMDRSDLGGWVAWTAPHDWASVTVSLVSGEGALARERNEGKDLAGLVSVRPLAGVAGAPDVELQIYGRDGSRGIGSARNRRAGGRIVVQHAYVGAGAEVMAGWGDGGDPALLPLVSSFWARTGPALPVIAWARVDAGWATRTDATSSALTWRVGAGPVLPWGKDAPLRPVYAILGYEGAAYGANGSPLAGVASQLHQVFVQVGVRFDAGVPLMPSAMRGVL